jgi:hypothetical protein
MPRRSPLDRDSKRAIGEALLKGWFAKVRNVLCASTFNDSPANVEAVARDAAAVMDLVSSLEGHVPLATFAVLVVKYGISRLCTGTR